MSERVSGTTILGILVLVIAFMTLSYGIGRKANAGNLDHADPYSPIGWFEVTGNDNHLVRYNPRTGESWVLICPTPATRDCAWDPIEVRDE